MSERAFDPEQTLRILAPGQRVFGRYTLEALAGRGGMGVVWRARDEELERTVALKFLPEVVAVDPEAVRDLKRETKRCLELTHPNIVRVYDFLQDGAIAAIAMEFVDGESLAKRKAEFAAGCLSVTELAPLVSQLGAALHYAHTKARIVHRDLKPANLLVARDGDLKVTDFGISRSLTETCTRLTNAASSGTSGTLLYMSPQQLGGDRPTESDDLYALGATLYELLTGKPPFFRGDAFSLMKQIAERTPAPLAAHRAEIGLEGPDIPTAWADAILACLEKTPTQRPATVAEFIARLTTTVVIGAAASAAAPNATVVIPRKLAQAVPLVTPARISREFHVTVEPPDADARLWLGPQSGVAVPADGRAVVKDLPDGEHELVVQASGYEPFTTRVIVENGRGQVEVRLVTLDNPRGLEVGQAWKIPDLGLVVQPIAAGKFAMGSKNGDGDEKPLARVTITRPFWLGKTEVTQREWQALMNSNPANFKGDDRPVETVSWTAAVEFCRKLTQRERAANRLPEGYAYMLPTEAQWKYACRAETAGDYAGNLDAMGWHSSNSGSTTHPVGRKQANAWGLHDMHGNIWEWCADWYEEYPGGAVRDPAGRYSGFGRVVRGGSWADPAAYCRSAVRCWCEPGVSNNNLGFRLALAPSP